MKYEVCCAGFFVKYLRGLWFEKEEEEKIETCDLMTCSLDN